MEILFGRLNTETQKKLEELRYRRYCLTCRWLNTITRDYCELLLCDRRPEDRACIDYQPRRKGA